ncbi:unnamed protein product [Rotaria sp. Silwood1]|nr:unnamed protein product [Rotaria sp. Silwood1]
MFDCDFSLTSCFENGELLITPGNEFTPADISEPPRAPLSDVSSISKPTNNHETCKLPYRPSINSSTNMTSSDIWFCYKNQCPTKSQKLANCTSGNYGLITMDAWTPNKTITQSINRKMMTHNTVTEHCLQYYYYFTVYDQLDWGQHISVFIKTDAETGKKFEIDRLSVADMIENRWHFRNKTFNATFSTYTLIFYFEVVNINRIKHQTLNKTIYFALDNIDLYNRNCQNVIESTTGPTTTLQSTTATTTKEKEELTASPPKTANSLGLILGKFANIRAQGTGGFDQTYPTDVKQSTSTTQCLDFYYYIPGTSNNPKIQVGWKAGEDTQQIIELTPLPENKWHNSGSSFTAPSSSSYQLTVRMIRDGSSTSHYFGLDEIKIYDQSCGSNVTTTIPIASTTITHASTTTRVSSDMATTIVTTTPILFPDTSSQSTATTTQSTNLNLGLVLGLSLGLGIPFVLGIIGTVVYYCTVLKSKQKVSVNHLHTDIPMTSTNDITDNPTMVKIDNN